MSNTTSTASSTAQETLRTARDAVGSAAEQVKAAGPAAYDVGAKAARYVGSTASEHVLTTVLVAAGLAYLAGWLTNSPRGGQSWQGSADAVRESARSVGSRVPEAAKYVSDRVARNAKTAGEYLGQGSSSAGGYIARNISSAGDYATRGVREYPLSLLVGAAVASGVLGYLLRAAND